MIIVYITGGIGNQLYQYAAGRRLAHKLNTELKLNLTGYDHNNLHPYALNLFNIKETIATPEEIEQFKSLGQVKVEKNIYAGLFMPEVLNYPDNIYLLGYWEDERYFADIADIIKSEFTLKNPLSPTAETYKQKILNAECSVSFHVRRGDFISIGLDKFSVLPLDYYYDCIDKLRHQYNTHPSTVFVFSDDINWCKNHFELEVPTEFVEGCASDTEDLILMSLCKHNVDANSTFSWWGSWLNKNPDKKVFYPMPSYIFGTNKNWRHFPVERNENSPLDSDKWIRIPFDVNKRLNIFLDHADSDFNKVNVKIRPKFSVLLVVNNDSATIAETLDSILKQDYRYYEVIIIDNASTDDSNKICRDAITGRENVMFKKLYSKVNTAVAWNIALDMAHGEYALFLKSGDRFLANALTVLYVAHGNQNRDIVSSFSWLEENKNGNVAFGDKKCSVQRDTQFKEERCTVLMNKDGHNAAKFLINKEINSFLGTKIYNCEFLKDNGIKFAEHLEDDEATFFFQMETFFKSKYFMYVSNAFYVAPSSKA